MMGDEQYVRVRGSVGVAAWNEEKHSDPVLPRKFFGLRIMTKKQYVALINWYNLKVNDQHREVQALRRRVGVLEALEGLSALRDKEEQGKV